MEPLEFLDFSGGITDNYIGGTPNTYQKADNLLIDTNKKLYSRGGSQIRDLSNYLIPNGNERTGFIWDHRDQTLESVGRNIYYANPAYNILKGPSNNLPFPSGTTTANYMSVALWNNQSLITTDSFAAPQKIYKDNLGVLQIRTAGLPRMAAPVCTGTAGTNNYIYTFLYEVTYNVEGVVFEDLGPTTVISVPLVNEPSVNTVAITGIPVIANGVTGNYDTANIKVKIYRTVNNDTVPKLIGTITNGTTTFNDTFSDASITNNAIVYTNGGNLDNDPPPGAKFVHIANDIAIYAHVNESGVVSPNRYRMSKKGDYDSAPAGNFDDLGDEITGVSSVQSTFILLCKNSIYRVDGFFDAQGRGGPVHQKISDTIGCVSHNSIVQTVDGIFFAGPQGFYFCDGYKVLKISHGFNTTYANLVSTPARQKQIFGAFDKVKKLVHWACQQTAASNDNDSIFTLDLNWGISDRCSFTTATGTSFFPTTLMFNSSNQMVRADKFGYVYVHDDSYVTDPKTDIAQLPPVWQKATIIYDFRSCAHTFGSSSIRKFVPWMLLTLKNVTNAEVQIYSINEDSKTVLPLVEIRFENNSTWGTTDDVWGNASVTWNITGLIEEKRRFPAKSLRCNFKQIRITNSYTVVNKSDIMGLATVDTATKTVTLNNVNAAWPTDAVDYYISFESDNYVNQYLVTTRTSDTVLVYQDTANGAPFGSLKWQLSGYKKGSQINFVSYVLYFKPISKTHKTFHSLTDTGGNQ